MSYIVVYQRADGSSGLEECADLDLAIVTAERLRNVDAVERPRIFQTEEIHYDFKPYYRVEVMAEGAAAAAVATETAEIDPIAAPSSFDDSLVGDPIESVAPVAEMTSPASTLATDEVVSHDFGADSPLADLDMDSPTEEPAISHDLFNADVAEVEELTPPEVPTASNGLFAADTSNIPDVPDVAEEAAAAVEPDPPRRGLFGR